jgi:two-component sensor histidine kinase
LTGSLVLNVDDDEAGRYARSRVLRHAGFEVIEAATGHEALELTGERHPELVLLDVGLPDISGIEVCRAIKRRCPTTLILQVSAAFTDDRDHQHALEGGADTFLTEPVDPGVLLATVRALLRLRAAIAAEREQAEEHQRFLVAELSHRVKNTLAMVQSIATQTLRDATSLEEASEAIGARIAALALAHDLLVQEQWAHASIRSVVKAATSMHEGADGQRFDVSGPELQLGPKAALGLALALHELCTNAVKFGSLSNTGGRVELAWEIVQENGEPHLHLRWAEKGGPEVKAPSRKGFGSRLLNRGLAGSFGGTVELSYPQAGFVLSLTAPLAAVRAANG